MAFTLTAGSTSGIAVTGTPYLTNVICEETSSIIIFVFSDGTTTKVTGTDGSDAIAALKQLVSHVAISDFPKL